jgi:hypothetical protein
VLENSGINFKRKALEKQDSINLAYNSAINVNKLLYTYSLNPYYESNKLIKILKAIVTNNQAEDQVLCSVTNGLIIRLITI